MEGVARTYTCKACGQNGFVSLGQLRKHYAEVGHPTKPRKPRAAAVEVEEEVVEERDREIALIEATVSLFDAELQAEQLTQDAYDRALSYLQSRYGSQAQPLVWRTAAIGSTEEEPDDAE
jgi:hypothetical protein